jgi:hypothetical protein
MPRVTDVEVRQLTGEPDTVDPAQAIAVASHFTDTLLATPGKITDADTLKYVELYLAGHFLLMQEREGPMARESFGDTSEAYHNIYGPGLEASRFGQQAMMFDTTGTLTAWSRNSTTKNKLKALFRVVGDAPSTPIIP